MVRYTWRSTLLMDVCYTWRLCWWLGALVDGGFAWMELWLMEALLGWCFGWWRFWFDGDLVDGGFATLMIWRQFLFYILPISWSLPPLRVGFLKPLLVGSKRTLAGSSNKSWSWMIWEDWSLPHRHYCIKWFLSIYYWVFHSYLVSIFSVIDLLLWCIND